MTNWPSATNESDARGNYQRAKLPLNLFHPLKSQYHKLLHPFPHHHQVQHHRQHQAGSLSDEEFQMR